MILSDVKYVLQRRKWKKERFDKAAGTYFNTNHFSD